MIRSRATSVRFPAWRATCLLVVSAVVAVGSVRSAAQPAPAARADGAQIRPASPAFERILLTAGRSRVLATDFDVTRIDVTINTIADANRVTAREILIDGKAPGTTSLILWGAGAGRRVQYDIVVDTGAPQLQQEMNAIFPEENIRVSTTEEAIVLSGQASSNEVVLRAGEIAQASSSKLKVINMLQRPGGPDTQQVLLEVRFAEVDHNALTELGTTLLADREKFDARTSTEQFAAPFIDASKPAPIVVPDYLNVFFFLHQEGLLAAIRALRERGLFQSLAEPNLIAYNGQEASFLAGGEFPIPIVQGNTGQVTIQFKEFGVKLKFLPTIAGESIRLKVEPEVSTLDFTNGLTLAGFRVPALKTRRAQTDVELRDGQSFAIAGLLDNQSLESRQMIPMLSNLPIIGHLFKSKSDTAARTELLVLITPRLVRPLNADAVPPLPVDQERFLKPRGFIDGDGKTGDPQMPKPGRPERKP